MHWEEFAKECIPRVKYASICDVPHLFQVPAHDGRCAIVGASPSVKNYVQEIAAYRADNHNMVMSLNAAHRWLINRNIIPNIHVIFEIDLTDPYTALGGAPDYEVTYYIASCCNERILSSLKREHKCVLWHAELPPEGYHSLIADVFPGEFMVSGGYATFFRSLTIGQILGYRAFDLYGVDSSFDGPSSHIEGYPIANMEPKEKVWVQNGGNTQAFTTQGGLAYQAQQVMEFCKVNPDVELRIHGDGLMRHLYRAQFPDRHQPQGV